MKRNSAGYSLVEILVAIAVGSIVTFAIIGFQSQMAKDNFAMFQKLEINEFRRDLSRIMFNDQVCTCNFRGLTLQNDTTIPIGEPASFVADFPAGQSLHSVKPTAAGCATTIPPEKIIAEPGQLLNKSRVKLIVQKISLRGLRPTNTTLALSTGNAAGVEYTGDIEVSLTAGSGSSNGAPNPVFPARITKRIFVNNNNVVVGCGAAPDVVKYVYSPDIVYNSAEDLNPRETIATCEQGYYLVSGGWGGLPPPAGAAPLPGCDGPENAVVRHSKPGTNSTGASIISWNVLAKCHPVQAVAVCFKSGTRKVN